MRSPKDRCSAHVRIYSILIAVLLLFGVGVPWQEAFAELTFMVLNPDRLSTPGSTETFMGTITNDTDADLSSGDLFLNFSGFDPANVTILPLLGDVSFTVAKGATSGPVDLFRATLGVTTKPGLYPIDMLLQSEDGDLSDPITASLRVVPEASTWILLMVGLLILLSIRGLPGAIPRKQRSAPYPK